MNNKISRESETGFTAYVFINLKGMTLYRYKISSGIIQILL